MNIQDYIRDVQDFPTEGILFKDITPLLNNSEARKLMLEKLYNKCKNLKIDKVVGIESRGFFFGMALADQLNAGFVPLRKKGKLPYSTVSQKYGLEYGEDELEMHTDAIQQGDNVLLHDDVLATGGTAKAACDLIQSKGGKIVQCNFIMKLDFLKGEEKLVPHHIEAVLNY
ncbi:adenine phosphoribosyltransferase [Pseudofulvibacter geojedonensis]|uniref:Adenine phosphoribosyltransferase n=1 Tax=Pseudofulvibacter geojedonensis TaxID=1123758 RepID=A0ABW3I0E4_9FLAO